MKGKFKNAVKIKKNVTALKYKSIKMRDKTSLQIAIFEPDTSESIRGVVQVIHGFGEHIDRYTEMADFFTKNNYVCIIHDQRGHGMMPGKTEKQRKMKRGIVSDYKLLIDDVFMIREKTDIWYPGVPVILYGHSMGGNIAINTVLKYKQSKYKKLIAESPWLRLYEPPSKVLFNCARVISKISHKIAVTNELDAETISRRTMPQEQPDEYYHNRISIRLFAQMTVAGEYAIKNAYGISIPTLVLCAGQDKIVCPKAINEFCRNADKNVVQEEYPDGYHALHNDIIKGEVLSKILEFCNE